MINKLKAFTLLELLIVIGILAILSTAMLIVINSADLLARARDSNRISDLFAINSTIDILAFNLSASLGSTNTVYVSLPSDESDCSDLNLSSLPGEWSYYCVTEANLRKVDGNGWIPINFAQMDIGSPLSYLFVDPTNTVADGRYYTYVSNYQLTACLESDKYVSQYPDNLVSQGLTTNTPEIILARCNSTPTTTTPPLVIGDSYQGGIIAYILQPGDPGYVAGQTKGLIAAPSDQSTAATWGCIGTLISGADGTAIGTGNQNTIDIMAGCSTAGIDARLCGDLTLNGYSDWYLPSKDELNKLYLNKVAVGGFTSNDYWSSSEHNANTAWRQHFDNGAQSNDTKKDNTNYVRAVRAF